MRARIATAFWLLLVVAVVESADASDIAGSYSGRYRCRDWNTVDLRIEDQGGDRIAGVFTFAVPGGASGAYAMTGQYDERTRRFQLIPQRWVGRPPQGYGMVGMTGMFDPSTKRLTGKIDNLFCFQFELAGEGGAPLAPLPASTPHVGARDYATDPVQNGIEYWDARMSAPPGTPLESEPIDDVIDWLRKEKFSCLGSARVLWDASGTKGTAAGRVDTRARFVVECDGDCRGMRYAPWTQAQVYHFDRSRPVPVMQMKGIMLGGTVVKWVFTRPPGGKAPDVYIHQWSATGFDSGPGCKAPRSGAKDTAGTTPDSGAPEDPRSRTRVPGANAGPAPLTK